MNRRVIVVASAVVCLCLLFSVHPSRGEGSAGDQENYDPDDYLGIADVAEYASDLESLGYSDAEVNEAISIMVNGDVDFAFGTGPDDLLDINWSDYETQLRVRVHTSRSGSCTRLRQVSPYISSCRVLATHLLQGRRHYKIEVVLLPCGAIPGCMIDHSDVPEE